ncbi:MAG: nucleotidyltransferase domain-containing protein [Candidatus Hydrogenedentes bacterium]|nr:nucleotidyltransferase domain-containing protein [Candidatus Hydrogenedentota bacterium]
MTQLSDKQRECVQSVAARLGNVSGVRAVVLGGSYARGLARPGSDIDLGIFYSESDPCSIDEIRALAESVNDTPAPVVTGFFEWGPWVNGGAWLTVEGQRIDFIYRSLEHVERVIADAEAGRYELNYEQQPPFGFFSATYLGEVDICVPLHDPESILPRLKQRVAVYPEPLRQSVVRNYLWAAEFALGAFARKYATRGDSYGTASCLTRAINYMVLALFALNRKYPINDKTVLVETESFDHVPAGFMPRVQNIIGATGQSPAELLSAVDAVAQLLTESISLTDGIYQSRYTLPT